MIKTYINFMNENKYYNETLNPKFWDDNMMFNQRIKGKLLTIANDFIDGIKLDIEIEDILLTGSLANYNYNEYSDFDVHIVIDFNKINNDVELVKIALDDERFMWNLKHNITIQGHEIEMYIQDISEVHKSSGVYSLQNNEWIKEPKYKEPNIDEEQVDFKTKEYQKTIDMLEKYSQDEKATPEQLDEYFDYAKKLKSKIHEDRKEALNKNDGKEFSVENLVFKELRNSGHFGKLIDLINLFYDKQYIQEGLNQFLTGPSEEEIKKNIKSKSLSELDFMSYGNNLDDLETLKIVLKNKNINNHFLRNILTDNCRRSNIEIVNYMLDNYIYDGWIIQSLMYNSNDDEIKNLLKKYYKKHYSFFKRFKEYNNIKEGLIDYLKGPTKEEIEKNKFQMKIDKQFIRAVDFNKLTNVKKYLENGADIHAENDAAIRYACSNGMLKMTKYLIEKGADINVNNSYPLRIAIGFNHINIVKCLVENGAEITLSVVREAKIKNNIEILEIIKSKI